MSTPEFDRQRAHTLRLLASILHNAQEAHRILTMVKDVRPQAYRANVLVDRHRQG